MLELELLFLKYCKNEKQMTSALVRSHCNNPFNGPLSRTIQMSQCKRKYSLCS